MVATGKTDPKEVVADEFAGQAFAFVPVCFLFGGPLSGGQIWATTAVGFVLFRVLDIVKPCPARRLERLPRGWGILCDDLMAAIYAAAGLLICFKLWVAG
jgi:phosphatidylglycerophosphatase A